MRLPQFLHLVREQGNDDVEIIGAVKKPAPSQLKVVLFIDLETEQQKRLFAGECPKV